MLRETKKLALQCGREETCSAAGEQWEEEAARERGEDEKGSGKETFNSCAIRDQAAKASSTWLRKKKKAKREGGEKARVWDFCEIAWTSVTTITSRKKKKTRGLECHPTATQQQRRQLRLDAALFDLGLAQVLQGCKLAKVVAHRHVRRQGAVHGEAARRAATRGPHVVTQER